MPRQFNKGAVLAEAMHQDYRAFPKWLHALRINSVLICSVGGISLVARASGKDDDRPICGFLFYGEKGLVRLLQRKSSDARANAEVMG